MVSPCAYFSASPGPVMRLPMTQASTDQLVWMWVSPKYALRSGFGCSAAAGAGAGASAASLAVPGVSAFFGAGASAASCSQAPSVSTAMAENTTARWGAFTSLDLPSVGTRLPDTAGTGASTLLLRSKDSDIGRHAQQETGRSAIQR